jgi:hypothetical protein
VRSVESRAAIIAGGLGVRTQSFEDGVETGGTGRSATARTVAVSGGSEALRPKGVKGFVHASSPVIAAAEA